MSKVKEKGIKTGILEGEIEKTAGAEIKRRISAKHTDVRLEYLLRNVLSCQKHPVPRSRELTARQSVRPFPAAAHRRAKPSSQ